jgi:hypothetical protein
VDLAAEPVSDTVLLAAADGLAAVVMAKATAAAAAVLSMLVPVN